MQAANTRVSPPKLTGHFFIGIPARYAATTLTMLMGGQHGVYSTSMGEYNIAKQKKSDFARATFMGRWRASCVWTVTLCLEWWRWHSPLVQPHARWNIWIFTASRWNLVRRKLISQGMRESSQGLRIAWELRCPSGSHYEDGGLVFRSCWGPSQEVKFLGWSLVDSILLPKNFLIFGFGFSHPVPCSQFRN